MTVTTTAPPVGTTGQGVRLAALYLPALLALTVLPRKKRRDLYLFALVLMMGFAVNGCGGDTAGREGGSPGTPAGTTMLTVRAMSGSQSAQTTLTLSVQ